MLNSGLYNAALSICLYSTIGRQQFVESPIECILVSSVFVQLMGNYHNDSLIIKAGCHATDLVL